MSERTVYLLQVLEKIGAPIMAAIMETSSSSDPAADAQAMAACLARSVKVSIDLAQAIDMNPVEVGDDSLRVGLAGLAAPLVAGQMRKKRGIPDESELGRITTAMQAVLTFSDNFAPSGDNAVRLSELVARGQPLDVYQTNLQYIYAFVPVVQAVSKFSFGQAEPKALVDISARVVKRAEDMRIALLGASVEGNEAKRLELGLVQALAGLYAAAHMAEIGKSGGLDMDHAVGPNLENVWKAFDLQSQMLEVLVQNLVPGAVAVKESVAPVSVQTPPTPPEEPPPVQSVPPLPDIPPPQDAPPQDAPPPPVSGNPMAMFVHKPKDEDQEDSPPPAQEAAQEPPPPPPVSPLPQTEGESGDEDEGDDSSGQSGNPMSFFKKGD